MKHFLITVNVFLLIACSKNAQLKGSENLINKLDSSEVKQEIPAKLVKLLNSYPEFLDSAAGNNFYWKDGTIMIYDDGIKNKTHEEMLNSPDIEDMLYQDYVIGAKVDNPPVNHEPGRIRYEPFFLKMYGNNSNEVQKKLINVKWVDGSILKFSNVNGAADNLQKVIEELKHLPSEFERYLVNPAGTFVWRNIAGTNRLSNHSFGMAIDINTTYSDYWQWDESMNYTNKIPIEIVKIFEKYGFIWGGKWYHYDTMHFEFRPELIYK